MTELKGLGRLSRERLSRVLRSTTGTISVGDVVRALEVNRTSASFMLSYWFRQGWVSKVKRGLYIPVPLYSFSAEPAIEDEWTIATRLFDPCYLGGWTAAEYWSLTDQVFQTTFVFSTKKQRNKNVQLANARFSVTKVSKDSLYGLKKIWRDSVKVRISDPSRTIIDFMNSPNDVGGIRPILDVLTVYMRSEYKDLSKLIEYAKKLGNKTVFKRMGFLAESILSEEKEFLALCKANMSKGISFLAPSLPGKILVAEWRLWVPSVLKEG